MATRRNPGEGGLHWEESRQRWFATVYVGYSPDGKRRKVKVSARTKTEAKAKLQQLLRDQDDGHVLGGQTYTVRDAVESWLAHGLTGRQESTVVNRTILARTHVIPGAGSTEAGAAIGRRGRRVASQQGQDPEYRHPAPPPVDLAPVNPPRAGARPGEAQCRTAL